MHGRQRGSYYCELAEVLEQIAVDVRVALVVLEGGDQRERAIGGAVDLEQVVLVEIEIGSVCIGRQDLVALVDLAVRGLEEKIPVGRDDKSEYLDSGDVTGADRILIDEGSQSIDKVLPVVEDDAFVAHVL